jgi:hypothetical protein
VSQYKKLKVDITINYFSATTATRAGHHDVACLSLPSCAPMIQAIATFKNNPIVSGSEGKKIKIETTAWIIDPVK